MLMRIRVTPHKIILLRTRKKFINKQRQSSSKRRSILACGYFCVLDKILDSYLLSKIIGLYK
jgi:hypothetical protein